MQVTRFPTAHLHVLSRLSLFRPPPWRFCLFASFVFLCLPHRAPVRICTAHRCGFAGIKKR